MLAQQAVLAEPSEASTARRAKRGGPASSTPPEETEGPDTTGGGTPGGAGGPLDLPDVPVAEVPDAAEERPPAETLAILAPAAEWYAEVSYGALRLRLEKFSKVRK